MRSPVRGAALFGAAVAFVAAVIAAPFLALSVCGVVWILVAIEDRR